MNVEEGVYIQSLGAIVDLNLVLYGMFERFMLTRTFGKE